MIPFSVLIAISLALIALLLVESVLYLARTGWYYRLGSALHAERWQTEVSLDAARAAVRDAMPLAKLSYREDDRGFCLRRHWAAMSAWPRISLRVEPGPDGAMLAYEVRPFITMAAFVPVFVVAAASGIMLAFFTVNIAVIAGIYLVFWPLELRTFGRLARLHDALAPIGVHVCRACGYDLFRQPRGQACPECGRHAPP